MSFQTNKKYFEHFQVLRNAVSDQMVKISQEEAEHVVD